MHGINLLMETLKEGMQLDLQSEKGYELKRFYKETGGDRRNYEPMADFIVRFQESLARATERGVPIDSQTAGWWLLERAHLNDDQYQRVISHMSGVWDQPTIVQALMRCIPRTVTDKSRAASAASRSTRPPSSSTRR